MIVSGLGLLLYIGLAIPLMGVLDSGGIALANSISYSIQGLILIMLLNRSLPEKFYLYGSLLRGAGAAAAAGLCIWLILSVLPIPLSSLFLSIVAIAAGGLIGAIPILREIRLLINL
jgi:peptidoglycan biosynthesis protein MviN/MurJ (putative lipid II flippase)